ncbi:MAG: HAMP domain-containing histidine kinase [Deltaproteobacteria bacterium]|nr:HAMP domain-containing histidine kinase [Deltaproteobacteria bacterium]
MSGNERIIKEAKAHPQVARGAARPLGAKGQPAITPPAIWERLPKPPGVKDSTSPAAENILERCFHELVRYYRHSSCGQLSQGLIHQMNSPTQNLFFQLELLEQRSQEELRILPEVANPIREKLQNLQHYRLQKLRQFRQELENIRALARNVVLQGSYEDIEDWIEIDLNELYRRELDLYLAQPFFKHRVEKRFYFQEGLPRLRGHYLDFSQSFRNLLENALEAMQDSERCCLTVSTALEDGRLILHLGDTGTGISPKLRSRVFEPFFTTKGDRQHRRAGLGLFMARRLLAPYGGEIRLDSIPGETWMTVTLPVN